MIMACLATMSSCYSIYTVLDIYLIQVDRHCGLDTQLAHCVYNKLCS